MIEDHPPGLDRLLSIEEHTSYGHFEESTGHRALTAQC